MQEALNTRSFSEEVINAIWFIHDTVPQLNSLIKEVESLQTEKNIIASSFKGASAEERVALQKRGLEIKEAIDAKKLYMDKLEAVVREAEMTIPNIPQPDVPMPQYSGERLAWKQLILRRVNRLRAEYSGG